MGTSSAHEQWYIWVNRNQLILRIESFYSINFREKVEKDFLLKFIGFYSDDLFRTESYELYATCTRFILVLIVFYQFETQLRFRSLICVSIIQNQPK